MSLFKRHTKTIVNSLAITLLENDETVVTAFLLLFSKLCTRGGLWTYAMSIQHEGHIRIADHPIASAFKQSNIFIVLTIEDINSAILNITDHALVLYDPHIWDAPEYYSHRKDVILYSLPFSSWSTDHSEQCIAVIGALTALLDYDITILETLLSDTDVHLIDSAHEGYAYAKEHPPDERFCYKLAPQQDFDTRMVLSGNDALGLGALKSDIAFCAEGSFTPSSLFNFLSSHSNSFPLTLERGDSESAAALMAVGASLAGARSLIITSGIGFLRSIEALSYVHSIETPLVWIHMQEYNSNETSQSELVSAIYASSNEATRIVVAPSDPEECFFIMAQACNISESYHLPVIILIDRNLATSLRSIPPLNETAVTIERSDEMPLHEEFKRFDLSSSTGVSLRSVLGQENGIFIANTFFHDEYGYATNDSHIRNSMLERHHTAFSLVSKTLPEPLLYGSKKADVTLIGWGSTKGAALEAIEILKQEHITANYIHLLYITPFPGRRVEEILTDAKTAIVIEENVTGQLANLISEYTGYVLSKKILRYDGLPFFPEDIAQRVCLIKKQKGLLKWSA